MLDRLRAGDISAAMTAVSPNRTDYFTNMFNNFGPDLPLFIDNIGKPDGGAFGNDFARYVVIREVNGIPTSIPTSFFLYYLRDDDGIWRIGEM